LVLDVCVSTPLTSNEGKYFEKLFIFLKYMSSLEWKGFVMMNLVIIRTRH